MSESPKIKMIKARFKYLQTKKQYWLNHYQLIGEYIMTRKQNFTSTGTPGEFLTEDLFDTTAPRMNALMASILIGMLWSNGAKTFRLVKPEFMPESESLKKFYEDATETMAVLMDSAESNLMLALGEYMLDQGSFGTSGIGVFGKDTFPFIQYKAWDVKTMFIDEGEDGKIDTIYNLTEYPIRKAVQKYGYDNLSSDIRSKYDSGKFDEVVPILHVIEPRDERDVMKRGSIDMPIRSLHLEWKSGKILRESGFSEMPIFVTRFYKVMGDVYGTSPGMFVLPDVIELNALWEFLTIAIEKIVSPPLAVLDDGRLGAGNINTSAGAVNVFRIDGQAGSDRLVFPLYTVGDIKSLEPLIQKLTDSIKDAYYIDRLLDLNNETRMTLGEAQIRDKIRGDSLGALFSRQETELFTPLINRTFNILFEKGLFGVFSGSAEEADLIAKGINPKVIPDIIKEAALSGNEVFRIQYISPAKRIMQAEEVKGMMTTLDTVNQYGDRLSDMAGNIDQDALIRRLHELAGGIPQVMKSMEVVEGEREMNQQIMAEERDLARKERLAAIGQMAAQAEATVNPKTNK